MKILDRIYGILFILVGLAFLFPLVVLHRTGEPSSITRVHVVLICVVLVCWASLFTWIGVRWFSSRQDEEQPEDSGQPDRHVVLLLKYRRLAEFAAGAGMLLAGIQLVALCIGAYWMPESGLLAIRWGSILIVLYSSSLFRPAGPRSMTLLRAGLLGYTALFLLISPIRGWIPWAERLNVQIVEYSAMLLLHASQVMVLHSGTAPADPNEEA